MKNKTKRTILTSVITLAVAAATASGLVAVNNMVNTKKVNVITSDVVYLNNIDFEFLSDASTIEGSPSEHKVYMSYETEDFVLIAFNYMDKDYEDVEDFAFTFGKGYAGNIGSFYVLSQDKILDVSLPEYDLSFTGVYAQASNPSSSATQVAWDIRDHIDYKIGNDTYPIDCYIYELSLENEKYDNHDINKIEILFAE